MVGQEHKLQKSSSEAIEFYKLTNVSSAKLIAATAKLLSSFLAFENKIGKWVSWEINVHPSSEDCNQQGDFEEKKNASWLLAIILNQK